MFSSTLSLVRVTRNAAPRLVRCTSSSAPFRKPKPEQHVPVPTLVFKDRQILVLNKPAGVVSQSARDKFGVQGKQHTIDDWMRDYCEHFGADKPHTVHRLDKQTTGALLLAQNPRAARELSRQIAQQSLGKTYLAVVLGIPKEPRGHLSLRLNTDEEGRPYVVKAEDTQKEGEEVGTLAEATYEVLSTSEAYMKEGLSLLRLSLLTGHKHQLRLQLSHLLKTPVFGDRLYGGALKSAPTIIPTQFLNHLFLHASAVELDRHTRSGKLVRLAVCVPPPWYFLRLCDAAGLSKGLLDADMFGAVAVDGTEIDTRDVKGQVITGDLEGVWYPDMPGPKRKRKGHEKGEGKRYESVAKAQALATE